jgi:hypothetical protein
VNIETYANFYDLFNMPLLLVDFGDFLCLGSTFLSIDANDIKVVLKSKGRGDLNFGNASSRHGEFLDPE